MAQSSGITKQSKLNPMTSSTYGFGQLILAALDHGARDFTLCIGGSATTDGGCGMATALGVRFIDEAGKSFVPCGETLANIVSIDKRGIDKRVEKSKFTVMCDVDNPLYGLRGAAYVYSPQKGASPEQVKKLDEGLKHLGKLLSEFFGKDFAGIPGAGAAGGLGAGCMAFLDAELVSGIDAILKLFDFNKHVSDSDLILTGEGKLDSQSFYGKVLSGLLQNAKGVPVWSICGVCDCDEALLRDFNLIVFETSEGISIEESKSNAVRHLKTAARKAIRQLEERNEY
jgi:glycerate kinase